MPGRAFSVVHFSFPVFGAVTIVSTLWCVGAIKEAQHCTLCLLRLTPHPRHPEHYNDPKHTSKVVAKWLQDNKVKVLEWPSQSTALNPLENVWAELKTHVRARRPANLIQLHQLCQEAWAKIHPTYCGKLVEGYPKCLT